MNTEVCVCFHQPHPAEYEGLTCMWCRLVIIVISCCILGHFVAHPSGCLCVFEVECAGAYSTHTLQQIFQGLHVK